MYCNNCGNSIPDSSAFCPVCGKSTAGFAQGAPQTAPQSAFQTSYAPNPVTARILPAIKSDLFLAVCILYSVSAGIKALLFNFSVIDILMTVFLWLLYSKGRKDFADPMQLRNISGTVFAAYVLKWVVWVSVIVSAVGVAVVIVALRYSLNDVFNMISDNLTKIPEIPAFAVQIVKYFLSSSAASIMIAVFSVVFILIGVCGILLNIFGTRTIHRFCKSLYESAFSGSFALRSPEKASVWIMVFGILQGVSALGALGSFNMITLISSGSKCAALIIISMMIKKVFADIK